MSRRPLRLGVAARLLGAVIPPEEALGFCGACVLEYRGAAYLRGVFWPLLQLVNPSLD